MNRWVNTRNTALRLSLPCRWWEWWRTAIPYSSSLTCLGAPYTSLQKWLHWCGGFLLQLFASGRSCWTLSNTQGCSWRRCPPVGPLLRPCPGARTKAPSSSQGSSGVTIPGGVQKTCKYGTSGHGLAGMVVLGWWLDLMILEVFSNLNDSMILQDPQARDC